MTRSLQPLNARSAENDNEVRLAYAPTNPRGFQALATHVAERLLKESPPEDAWSTMNDGQGGGNS